MSSASNASSSRSDWNNNFSSNLFQIGVYNESSHNRIFLELNWDDDEINKWKKKKQQTTKKKQIRFRRSVLTYTHIFDDFLRSCIRRSCRCFHLLGKTVCRVDSSQIQAVCAKLYSWNGCVWQRNGYRENEENCTPKRFQRLYMFSRMRKIVESYGKR